jgi:hypothetical protein
MTTMKKSDLTLQEALAQLRDYTADEVADLLHLAGKTGDVGDMTTCPVAHYLADVLDREVYVDTHAAWVVSNGEDVDLPGGVGAFVAAFDHHRYSDLITPTN